MENKQSMEATQAATSLQLAEVTTRTAKPIPVAATKPRKKRKILTQRNKIWTLDELMKDRSVAPPAIIGDGVLLCNSLLLIVGAPKIGKSFLAMNMALAIAAGKGFAGFKVNEAHKVLLLSAEGGHFPNRDRLKTMSRRFDLNNPVRRNLAGCFDIRWKIDNDGGLSELKNLIRDHGPRVLVLDPLIRFHAGEENSAQEMSHTLGGLRSLIQDHDLAVILVHHEGKVFGNGPRGSSAIAGEYDSSIAVKKGNGKVERELTFDMRHVETPPERKVLFNSDTLWFEETTEVDPVLEILRNATNPLSKKEIAEQLVDGGHYSQAKNAYPRVNKAQKKGVIVANGDGKFSPKLYSLPTPILNNN